MGADHAERRLVAILAADIVGYSRLIEADEAGTLAAMKALRSNVTNPLLAEYHGRIVKLMGDGAIMEFGSVVDAVTCAVALQKGFAAHQATVPPERRIIFRMGVNLGDVVVEGDDLLGDGVNVAARLEQLCDSGGLFVSGTAYDQLPGKFELPLEFVGERHVKNITRPVRAYRVKFEGSLGSISETKIGRWRRWGIVAAIFLIAAVSIGSAFWFWPRETSAETAMIARMKFPLPDKPSIAVLPIEDFSAGPEQSYFADGITEDVITELSKVPGIFVIARHSAFTYKGIPTKVQEVAEDLGVRYVLEGNLRRDGDQLRIEAQLIDAIGNHTLWDKHFDGVNANIFALQRKIIGEIVTTLPVDYVATQAAEPQLAETSPEAYDALLQGWGRLRRNTDSDMLKAITLFDKTVSLDPYYSRAHAALAAANWQVALSCWDTGNLAFRNALQRVDQSLPMAMLSQCPLAYSISSEVLAAHGRYNQALIEIDRALSLDPNEPENHIRKAKYLNATGRAAEAEQEVRLAMRLDPKYPPDYLRTLAIAQFHQERYENAVETLRFLTALQWDVADDYVTLASGLGHLNRTSGVQLNIAKFNGIAVRAGRAPLSVQAVAWRWYDDMFDYNPLYRDRLLEGLRKAGVPEGAGTDIPYDTYARPVSRINGEYTVNGAAKVATMSVKRLYDDGAKLIDVRSTVTFNRSHVPGAVSLPAASALSSDTLSQVAGRDDKVIFACQGKYCVDAAFASAKALAWGYNQVFYFAEGFPGWIDAGYPMETTPRR